MGAGNIVESIDSIETGKSQSIFTEIDTLRGFEYSVACTGISITPDCKRILAIGTYKPSIKLFDLENLSLKFERHAVTDLQKVLPLLEDADKFAALRADRVVEFHTRNGLHDTVRYPKRLRDIVFNSCNSELYSCADENGLSRFNLEQGRFLPSISSSAAAHSLVYSCRHGLLAAVASNQVDFIDTRTHKPVLGRHYGGAALTSAQFDDTGLHFIVGREDGTVGVQDILGGAEPKNTMRVGDTVHKIVASDEYILVSNGMRIFVFLNDDIVTVIDPEFQINDFDVKGGLLAIGGENEDMRTYFAGCIEDAPAWLAGQISE